MKSTSLFLSTLLFISPMVLHAEDEPTFGSMTYPERFETGLVRTEESEIFLDTAPRESFDVRASVPKSASLRGRTGAIENQGGCGSCWSFALTTVLRGTLMNNSNDPGRLSYNYLLNCTPSPHGQGCRGGDFAAADLLIAPKGAPAYGADGSYNGTDGSCKLMAAKGSATSYKLLGTNLGNNPGRPKPSFRDIAYAVGVLNRPVAVDVIADSKWKGYRSGVYNGCTSDSVNSLNHMVVVEGYDCESAVDGNGRCLFDSNGNLPAGVGTWTIRNSWGTGWGDGGYIKMKATDKQGKRCNAIASDALYYSVN